MVNKTPSKLAIPGQGQKSILDANIVKTSADKDAPVKTSGIKIRGTGAATKGVMARGPMA